MNGITLREGTVEDAPALGALHVASWRETYAGLLPDAMLAELSVATRATMWADILSNPAASGGMVVFVAEADDRLVGFGCCSAQRDQDLAAAGFSGEIGAIYILRAHQGGRVGRAIMAALSRALADMGHFAASLWVLRDNAAARSFYERLGGGIIGERTEVEPEATLVELAYGWRDLSRLNG